MPGREVLRLSLEDRVVFLVNQEREARRLRPLRRDELLRTAARAHSADMARRRYFAHVAPGGSTPYERMIAAGVTWPGGENIAMGHERPVTVVQGWMRSLPHRANILHPEFRAIGVGVCLDPSGPWWTQNFGF